MATDSLSQFDGRFDDDPAEAVSDQELNEDQQDEAPEDAAEQGDGGAGAREAVPYQRYEEVNSRMRELERRNDELTRMLLSDRQQGHGHAPVDDEADPDVERSIKPILDRELKPVRDLAQKEARREQMAALEELSPGIGAMWSKLEAEFKTIPAHLQPEFDGMAGAIALRARVEAKEKAPANRLKNRSHTEASPGTTTGSRGQVTPEDVGKMTKAEFDKFVDSLRGRRPQAGGGGYDPLIR